MWLMKYNHNNKDNILLLLLLLLLLNMNNTTASFESFLYILHKFMHSMLWICEF